MILTRVFSESITSKVYVLSSLTRNSIGCKREIKYEKSEKSLYPFFPFIHSRGHLLDRRTKIIENSQANLSDIFKHSKNSISNFIEN